MSVADLLPDAPFGSLDSTDWFMYSDMLVEREESDLCVKTARQIAKSLELDRLLIPAACWDHVTDVICVPWDAMVDGRHVGDLEMEHPAQFAWLKPSWLPRAAEVIDLFPTRATPWSSSSDSFARTLRAIHGTRRWIWLFRNPFFHVHSMIRPKKPIRFSPVLSSGLEDGEAFRLDPFYLFPEAQP